MLAPLSFIHPDKQNKNNNQNQDAQRKVKVKTKLWCFFFFFCYSLYILDVDIILNMIFIMLFEEIRLLECDKSFRFFFFFLNSDRIYWHQSITNTQPKHTHTHTLIHSRTHNCRFCHWPFLVKLLLSRLYLQHPLFINDQVF